MAATDFPDQAVLVDDEPQNIIWLIDFLEAKGIKIHLAETANEALEIVEKGVYRFIVVDLNIPLLPPLEDLVRKRGSGYYNYPGLFVAERARNSGYRSRQVIIYSVHRGPEVAQVADRLGVNYIMKGRPREIKSEIETVIKFDPTNRS